MDALRMHEYNMDSASRAHHPSSPDKTAPRARITTLDGHTVYIEDDVWRIPNRGPLNVG